MFTEITSKKTGAVLAKAKTDSTTQNRFSQISDTKTGTVLARIETQTVSAPQAVTEPAPKAYRSREAILADWEQSRTRLDTARADIDDVLSSFGATADNVLDKAALQFGAVRDEQGNYLFENQAALDRYNRLRENLSSLYDTYSTEVGTFNGLKTEWEGYDAAVSELNSRRSRLEEQRRLLSNGRGDRAQVRQINAQIDSLDKELAAMGAVRFDKGQFGVGLIEQGLPTIAKMGGDTLSFLEGLVMKPAGKLMGWDDFYKTGMFYKLDQGVEEELAQAQQKHQANLQAGGKLAQIANDLGVATVAALPQAVAAMLTGGGALADKGLRVAQSAPGFLGSLKTAVTSTAKNPMFWTSYFQTVGGEYESAIADGASEAEATLRALATAAINAQVEVGGGLETLPKELQSGKSAVKQWIKSMMDEGKEEVVQGIISRATENLFYDKGNPLFSVADKNAVINPVTAAEEFGGGAFVGGLLGGGQIALGSALDSGGRQVPSFSEEVARQLQESLASGNEKAAPQGETVSVDAKPSAHSPEAVPSATRSDAQIPAAQETAPARTFAEEVARQTQGENVQTIGGLKNERSTKTERPDGNGVSGGIGQRDAGTGAGGEAGGLAESTVRARQRAAEQSRTAAARQDRAKSLRLTTVSSRELGLQSGTDARVTRVMPEEYWDEAMRQTAQRVRQETGRSVTFTLGAIQVRDAGGKMRRVRGVYSDDRIILQADNLQYTVAQIADHEIFHDKSSRSPGLIRDIRQQIMQQFSREEFEQVVEKYIQSLRGLIDVDESGAGDNALDDILEEIFADAYAEMNAFGARAEQFMQPVEQVLEERGLGRGSGAAAATERTTGPPKDDKYLFSAADENTPLSNEEARDDAERLEMQGVDAETIRQQTGWFRDSDGQWNRKTDAQDTSSDAEGSEALYENKNLAEDGDIYTYDFLTSLPDMKVVTLPEVDAVRNAAGRVDAAAVVEKGIKNARSVGTERDGKISVQNRYTGKHLLVTTNCIRHGLNGGMSRLLTNARLGAVIGDVVKNAVPINALQNKASGVSGTYAMAGYATDSRGREFVSIITVEQYDKIIGIDIHDATHAVSGRQKKSSQADTKSQGFYPIKAATVSITDLLNVVNITHQSILSEDVLSHLGESRNPAGDYTGQVKFSAEEDSPQSVTEDRPANEQEALAIELQRRSSLEYQQELLAQGGRDAINANEREVRRLRRRLDKLQGKQRPAKKPKQKKPPQESVPSIAKKELQQNLLSLFSIPEGRRAEFGGFIDRFADQLLKDSALSQKARDAFFERMYAAGVVTVRPDPYYAAGRSAVAGGRIYVNDQIRSDFGDDWNEFRKRAFGAGVYLTGDKNASGVDVWNHELAEALPGMFSTDESDGRSILERIVQAAEEGRDERMSLADYTAAMAREQRITEDEMLDGIERQMDWALRTFAEKAKLEIRLRDRTGVKLAQLRADHKDMLERQRADRELRELQQKTLKQLQWLSKNRNRAPGELQSAFDEVLADIDIYAVGAADEMNWSDRHNATWRDLARMYKDARKHDPNFLPSKELERIISRLDDQKIGEMDPDALRTLYQAAVGLRREFHNRNNVINDQENRLFEEVYAASKEELESAYKGYDGKWWNRLLNLEQLTPLNLLQRMAGWNPKSVWYSMARQLEKGERDVRSYTVEANRYLEQFLTEHEDWAKRADGQGEDAIWYELQVPELAELKMGDKPIFGATVTVYMTPAQKVQLYLESKSPDNLRHMVGGRTFVNRQLYSEGKRREALAQGRTIKLAPETVKKIVSDLTAEEMELARLLEGYYNSFAKERINRVSNILYGYDKAMGRYYAPIFTNQNYTSTEIGIFDATAEGVGNLKTREYSKTPSYNLSAFDAFERNVGQTARFVGMSIPARNWTTLLNWQVKGNSMADVLTHKWGEESKTYILDLLTDLQGGSVMERDTLSEGMDKLFSKYIGAVFGANPSIVLKQLGSIPLAGAYLDMKNIPSMTQLKHIDRSLIARYTQELDYRTMGYSMPETKILKDNPGLMQSNKFLNFTFGGGAITAMDGWAASTLWPWAENKVRRDFPELEVGTQEQIDAGQSPFYQKVAELYNEAVTRTQSMTDQIHQSKLRKSRNPLTRTFTMFKSDAAQGYNVLRQKIGEAQYYARTGADDETQRKAKRDAGSAFLALLAGYTYSQVITFLMALWKRKDDRYRDEEGELAFDSVAKEIAFGLVGDFAGMVSVGQEMAEFIGHIFTGERWYGLETPGTEQLNDMLDVIEKSATGLVQFTADLLNVTSQGGNPLEYIRRYGNDMVGGIKDVAAATATYLPGLPVNNLEAYLLGTVRWVCPAAATAYEDLLETATKKGLSGLKGEALQVRIHSILENRLGEVSGETAQALAELYEAGHKSAVPTDTPGKMTADGEELSLDAYQQQFYDQVWRSTIGGGLEELVESDAFLNADAEGQAAMANKLYDYAGERAKSALSEKYEPDAWVGYADAIIREGASVAEWASLSVTTKDQKDAEKYHTILDSDMPENAKAAAFGSVMGTELTTESGKPSQYAKMLDVLKSGADLEDYLDLREAASVEEYLENLAAGIAPKTALEIALQVAEVKERVGEDVTDLQLYRAAVDAAETDDDRMAALQGLMTDSEYEKLAAGHSAGISPEHYVSAREAIAKIDDNGTTSQTEASRAIAGMQGLSVSQKAVLWQLQDKSWSAKNNPFSPAVGARVKQAMEGSKGVSLPNLADTPPVKTSGMPEWISLPKP